MGIRHFQDLAISRLLASVLCFGKTPSFSCPTQIETVHNSIQKASKEKNLKIASAVPIEKCWFDYGFTSIYYYEKIINGYSKGIGLGINFRNIFMGKW